VSEGEFDRFDEVIASSSLEEKKRVGGVICAKIKADPDQGKVHINLYPTLVTSVFFFRKAG
jgi:hypothetical protein